MKNLKKLVPLFILFAMMISLNCSGSKTVEEKKDPPTKNNKPPVVKETIPPKATLTPENIERIRMKENNVDVIDKLLFSFKNNRQEKKGKLSTSSYNKEGLLIETVTFEKNKVEFRYTYKYDANKNRIETLRYNSKGILEKKFKYEYDDDGLKIKSLRTSVNDITEKYYEYEYDSDKNLTEEKWFDVSGKLEFRIEYENKNGRKEKAFNYDENDNLEFITDFAYDKNGNIVEEIRKNKDGKTEETIQYVYKYDK